MKNKRDSKRQAVYDSEILALKKHPLNIHYNSIHEVRSHVKKIINSKWYRSYIVKPKEMIDLKSTKPYRHCEVKDGRGRRKGGGTRGAITLPKATRYTSYVLHELTHHMQFEKPWHGRQFCAIYLDLVKRWMDYDAWKDLKSEFAKRNIRYSAKCS